MLQIINILSISIYDNCLNCINPVIMFIEQRSRSRSAMGVNLISLAIRKLYFYCCLLLLYYYKRCLLKKKTDVFTDGALQLSTFFELIIFQ